MIAWSVGIAAVAFVFLVVFLVLTLRKLMATLAETKKTLSDARESVNSITDEAEELIHEANKISVDVKGKMESVDPLVDSVRDMGEMLHNATSSMKRTALKKENRKTIHTQETDDTQDKKKIRPVRIKLK
ncbi:DUF948 domain-containing protein [Salipaludibacillus sp. CUR1]|uniref:DUF948 domain-containing protein n=1 Tax=Salipaludibacillus sp. CUR1 TaxID=2820003 RepID=UPI001E5DE3A5|nr:DUF948 domain-containing protein [Salipaludibacillus sp. CUR1]MCE7792266.1 DUF948 domain-containing protein [Salipaludibacillus sp. CUR1]